MILGASQESGYQLHHSRVAIDDQSSLTTCLIDRKTSAGAGCVLMYVRPYCVETCAHFQSTSLS